MIRIAIVKAFLDWLYGVDNVLKNFNKAVRRLEKAKAYHDQLSTYNSEVMKKAEARRDAAQQESLRADAVAEKLRTLIGA